jgi:hypothetical protein
MAVAMGLYGGPTQSQSLGMPLRGRTTHDARRCAARPTERRGIAVPEVNAAFAGALARGDAQRHHERHRRPIAQEDRNRDRSSRRPSEVRTVTLWQEGRDHPELTHSAMGAAHRLDARHPLHELGNPPDDRGLG